MKQENDGNEIPEGAHTIFWLSNDRAPEVYDRDWVTARPGSYRTRYVQMHDIFVGNRRVDGYWLTSSYRTYIPLREEES